MLGLIHEMTFIWIPQVFHQLKRVQFSIRNTSFYFDKNGDPPTGYDIVTWVWTDDQWLLKVVGNYTPGPTELQLDASQIKWTGQVSPVTKASLFSYMRFFLFSLCTV